MTYNIIFRNHAVEEMGDAYQWYEQSVVGLGMIF
jgi:hypothetical protein